MQKAKRGFTLIELLVVIAIIGMLASIVLASLSGARRKSRDARRLTDIKTLENAVQLYVSTNNASPANLAALTVSTACGTNSCIPVIPTEPSGGTAAYGYVQLSGGAFVLGAILETAGQAAPLNIDYDTAQAITINGAATNCNTNAGAATEVVYCVYTP